MIKPRWFARIPPAKVVLAHESDHPRPDGIRLGRITVDSEEEGRCGNYVAADDRSYGEWICYHDKSLLQPYVSVIRLKAVDGVVLMEIGFTQWTQLHRCVWVDRCRFFPVGHNGLPLDYRK